MTCLCHLKCVAVALMNYENQYHCFPPAYVADKSGKPIHSWRVLILPYCDSYDVYKQYDFNEPWNGPNNRKLLKSRPSFFACPSDGNANAPGATCTSYAAVVGANAAWPGTECGKFINDSSKTIMLVEMADANIPWTEPQDVSLDAILAASPSCILPSSRHGSNEFFTHAPRSGSNIALADGSVRFLPGGLLASDKFPGLLKVGGCREEYLQTDWPDVGRRIHWPHCIVFAVWLVSSGWLMVRAVRSREKATSGGEEAPLLIPNP